MASIKHFYSLEMNITRILAMLCCFWENCSLPEMDVSVYRAWTWAGHSWVINQGEIPWWVAALNFIWQPGPSWYPNSQFSEMVCFLSEIIACNGALFCIQVLVQILLVATGCQRTLSVYKGWRWKEVFTACRELLCSLHHMTTKVNNHGEGSVPWNLANKPVNITENINGSVYTNTESQGKPYHE